jgi:hypothetical protein
MVVMMCDVCSYRNVGLMAVEVFDGRNVFYDTRRLPVVLYKLSLRD